MVRGTWASDRNENTDGKEDIDANEDEFCRLERNLIKEEKV